MPASRTTQSSPAPTKFSQVDYSLPPSFLALLSQPLHTVLDRLLPLPTQSRGVISPPRAAAQNAPTHPFIQAMLAAPDTLTENRANAYRETLSPLVDLFFDMVEGISTQRLNQLLRSAWAVDPNSTMRIIIHARSIHEGKGMEQMFYRCMAWVWAYHPRTMLSNLHLITDPTCMRDRSKARDEANAQRDLETRVQRDLGVLDLDADGNVEATQEEKEEYPPRPHGCFKDLLDLLTLHINGQLDPDATQDFDACKEAISPNILVGHKFVKLRKARRISARAKLGHNVGRSIQLRAGKVSPNQSFTKSVWLAQDRKAKDALLRERFEKAITTDKKFQALYLVVLELFEEQLRSDLNRLESHKDFLKLPDRQRGKWKGNSSPFLFGLSYAAKWAASPGKTVDRQYMFASALAIKFHPALELNVARMKLQQEVLTPLRQATSVPERNMVEGQWSIDYTKTWSSLTWRVPARCMARNAENFAEHDPVGFERYLTKVLEGSTTVSGASLFPHELLIDAMTGAGNGVKSRLANLQWRALVDSLRSSSASQLQNSLAVADVSGSMGSLTCTKDRPTPIARCIALTLLLGELAMPPWSGGFFTFSSEPTFETIDITLPLSQRATTLSQAHWQVSTSFYKVFDLILNMARRRQLPPEHMVKRLFVFSDMQFDVATNRRYGETEHQTIQRKFAEAGYAMPEMVYWNLAGRLAGTPKPVRADEKGVSLVSGWSGALMKFFLRQQAEDDIEESDEQQWERANIGPALNLCLAADKKDPLQIVTKMIGNESFNGVVIVD